MLEVLMVIVGIVIGAGGLYAFLTFSGRNILALAHKDAELVRATAQRDGENKAREMELAAREQQQKQRITFDKENESARRELREHDQRLTKREETLAKQIDTLTFKERSLEQLDTRLGQREKVVTGKEKQVDQLLEEQRATLLQVTGMTPDAAREMLMTRIENETRRDTGAMIQRIVEQATEEAREKSRQILLQAIQRYAADQTCDHTVSTVEIPSDDMKGRVIGREGRNIRAFEKETGVDVIIDDTPGVVVVSCFDPVRREVARMSLERLISDGRIHPARIEEVVAGVTKEMEEDLVRIGREAAVEANLPNLAKPIIPMLGRLAYRTSYGQNVLRHSMEVAYLCQVMASEMGLDPTLARRAGLLHDIGKAMDHETEGGHPQIGKEFLKKFNEVEAVLNACEGHHGDVPPSTPYTFLVMAADAVSASRPGARRESLERYIKRLTDLEDIAKSFEGVRQAYAIQAGREVRVLVDAKSVDDKIGAKIARDIAKKIEDTMTYPGEIRVTLIRETRAVEYAR